MLHNAAHHLFAVCEAGRAKNAKNAKGMPFPMYVVFGLSNYFLVRPWLRILSVASAFSRAVDDDSSKSRDDCMLL